MITGWFFLIAFAYSAPVFAVVQQLLHVHLFLPQTSKGRLKLGGIVALQGHTGLQRAEACVHIPLDFVPVRPGVFDEV